MSTDLANVFVELIRHYGYAALFIYFVLETAFILHFAPSEIVIPVAASVLVDGPVTFALFVLDATAGSTVGSYLLYYLFDQHGERVLMRYGPYLHISEREVERSQRWFQRWGEHSVFWGRLLPFVRALISIPAGVAHMNRGKFILYSAAGAAVFTTALTYLAYAGTQAGSPIRLIVEEFGRVSAAVIAYGYSHLPLLVVVVGLGLIGGTLIWRRFVTS